MSNSTIGILVIAVLVIVIGFVIIQYFRRRSAKWAGSVIDKGFTEHVDRDTVSNRSSQSGSSLKIGGLTIGGNMQQRHVTRSYYIRVQTDEGKEIKWPVSEGLYETIKIGDRLTKEPGTQIPRIAENAPKI